MPQKFSIFQTAFGSSISEMSYSSDASGGYKYGFNNQEKDDEVVGNGDFYAFEYRIEDTRIGRFLSIDPLSKKFPFYSPYQFASNSPIVARELEGLESELILNKTEKKDNIEINWNTEASTPNTTPLNSNTPATTIKTVEEKKQCVMSIKDQIDNNPLFDFIRVAGSFIGTKEVPGIGVNPLISTFHKLGGKFNSDETQPWCASFANYCLLLGNPENFKRTNKPSSSSFYLMANDIGLVEVPEPFYGSFMVRSNNGKFTGGEGHVAIVVGIVGTDQYAQLGGNQAVPGADEGTVVNVVLRTKEANVRYFHYIFLPQIRLGPPLFKPATTTAQKQLGTDR